MTDLSRCPLLSSTFDILPLDDGANLEDKGGNTVHYVNGAAAYILSLCDGETPLSLIVDQFSRQFTISDGAQEIVLDAMEQLERAGIIRFA